MMGRGSIEVEQSNSNSLWIRSTWPVTSPRGDTCCLSEHLSDALARGILVECDAKRSGFFEVTLGHSWVYFHVADKLRRIYLVSTMTLWNSAALRQNDLMPSTTQSPGKAFGPAEEPAPAHSDDCDRVCAQNMQENLEAIATEIDTTVQIRANGFRQGRELM